MYKTPLGVFPSVTTILSIQDEGWVAAWRESVGEEEANRISNEATTRGSLLHLLIEKYLKNEPIEIHNSVMKGHFLQIKSELDKLDVILANEIPLYSAKLKVAGRCDCVAKIGDDIHIIDFKTSKHAKQSVDSYRMQCSAYIYMLNEMFHFTSRKYRIIISNLFENHCSIFDGNIKDSIIQFAELRKKWNSQNI